MQDLGASSGGEARDGRLRPEPRGTPGEEPLVFAKAGVTERREVGRILKGGKKFSLLQERNKIRLSGRGNPLCRLKDLPNRLHHCEGLGIQRQAVRIVRIGMKEFVFL